MIIRINNARFYSYHGVHGYEKEYGNEFQIDIKMDCDLSGLGDTDDLHKTVDYLAVYKLTQKIFNEHKFNLIETVNKRICKAIMDNFSLVKSVEVKVRKLNAPLGIIDSVEIINSLNRN